MTPRFHRPKRLALFSEVALGAIALGRWCFIHKSGRETRAEKLLLPLRAEPGDIDISVLGFIDWDHAETPDIDVDLQRISLPEIILPVRPLSSVVPSAERPLGHTWGS